MKKYRFLIASVAVLTLSGAAAEGKITIVQPKGANATKTSICPAKDGSNQLVPVPVTYLAPASSAGLMAEITGGDTKFASPPWTFNKGAALNGTLTVDVYRSQFKATHHSGGQISLRYEKGKGDPANLRWVQLINTSAPLNKAKPPYIDPFPNDDPAGKGLPFYYTQDEIKTRANGKNTFGNYSLRFYDFSSRSHPPTTNVTWTADLYLASWDAKQPGTVTIHDGIRWGWKAGCAAKKPAKPATPATDTSKTAVVPDKGSRLVATGTVVAGEQATITVVDPQGAVLSGVVVDIEGQDEELTTDSDGRITLTIPENVPSILWSLRDLPDAPLVETPVESLPAGWNPAQPPVISDAPHYPQVGSDLTIQGGPFDGDATGNTVAVGDEELEVHACTPTEIVASTPSDWAPGDQGPLTVTTAQGTSQPWDLTVVGIGFESGDTKLKRGQKGTGLIVVHGTTDRLQLRITNLTPGIISLKGGETITVRTSGGAKNGAKIQYTGVSPGNFSLNAVIVEGD
jgi:hypothetical protein